MSTNSTVPASQVTPTTPVSQPKAPTEAEVAALKRAEVAAALAAKPPVVKPTVVEKVKDVVEKFCSKCGVGSHRLDWQGVPSSSITCVKCATAAPTAAPTASPTASPVTPPVSKDGL